VILRALHGMLAALAIALMAAPGAAQARWLRAETQRFVVYSDGDEAKLREFTVRLAEFDQVLRLMHGVRDQELERKLDVYLISGASEFRRVLPYGWGGVLGFYSASPQSVYALVLNWRDAAGFGSDDVLFHEYTHHFMLEYFPAAYPSWLIEGYAEYFATTAVSPQYIEIGRYNALRAAGLLRAEWMPLHDLLTVEASKVPYAQRNAYYGQSWLLTHYMMTDESRARQLDAANRAVLAGKPADKAMEEATGLTLEQLNHNLHQYVHTKLLFRRMSNPFGAKPPNITVTELPASADELMPERLAVSHGLSGDGAKDTLAAVRSKAKRFPGDSLAELTLAQAELRYGDRAAAQAILERRLAANPKEAESLRLMGERYLVEGQAEKDKARRIELFKASRPYLSRAFAVDGNDYRTLYDYALARTVDPDYPNENTLNVLLLAVQLAPSVEESRFMAGQALLTRGRKEDGIAMLIPLANSPHGRLQAKAAELIAKARGEPVAQPNAKAEVAGK
jgi:hypothetical protein